MSSWHPGKRTRWLCESSNFLFDSVKVRNALEGRHQLGGELAVARDQRPEYRLMLPGRFCQGANFLKAP